MAVKKPIAKTTASASSKAAKPAPKAAAAATKPAAAPKAAVKVAAAAKGPATRVAAKAQEPRPAAPAAPAAKTDPAPALKAALSQRERHTPPVFKVPGKKLAPIVFSLEEVREVLKNRKATPTPFDKTVPAPVTPAPAAAPKAAAAAAVTDAPPREIRKLGAASLADLLGGRATARKPVGPYDEAKVPAKWKPYFKLLIDLRQHVLEGLEMHTQDTLLRSSREDSGDLSGYGQHMADAGTETFDRDFALSLVSSEQEALSEIEAAIQRIFNGTYGVCEITGEPISAERLEAVPFTRYSLAGQAEHERQNRRHVHRGGLFLDASVEDAANFSEDDIDE